MLNILYLNSVPKTYLKRNIFYSPPPKKEGNDVIINAVAVVISFSNENLKYRMYCIPYLQLANYVECQYIVSCSLE